MKKDTLVVICNYNRKNDVDNLILSLIEQDNQFFDVLLVDNASTDGSVEYLMNKHRSYITFLIQNDENLGGSGGFNKGMKFALENNYSFFVLLDSDVVLKNNCLSVLKSTLLLDKNKGIVGSKVLQMLKPGYLQEVGGKIDWNKDTITGNFYGKKDSKRYNKIFECDYVAACALMARTEVLKKIGFFDESFYIYMDDVDWGYRCKKAGWKVVANGNAECSHKGGFQNAKNLIQRYYFKRNLLYFFIKNRKDFYRENPKKVERKAEELCQNTFKMLFGLYLKKMDKIKFATLLYFEDFMKGKNGRSDELTCINEKNETYQKILFWLNKNKSKTIVIDWGGCKDKVFYSFYFQIINLKLFKKLKIIVTDSKGNFDNKKNSISFKEKNVELYVDEYPKQDCFVIKLVDSIYNSTNYLGNQFDCSFILCDPYLNIIANDDDLLAYKNFPLFYDFFKSCYKERIVNRIKSICL